MDVVQKFGRLPAQLMIVVVLREWVPDCSKLEATPKDQIRYAGDRSQ